MSDMYYGFSENTDPVNNGYSQESGNNNSYGSPAEPPKKKKGGSGKKVVKLIGSAVGQLHAADHHAAAHEMRGTNHLRAGAAGCAHRKRGRRKQLADPLPGGFRFKGNDQTTHRASSPYSKKIQKPK